MKKEYWVVTTNEGYEVLFFKGKQQPSGKREACGCCFPNDVERKAYQSVCSEEFGRIVGVLPKQFKRLTIICT